MSTAPTLQELAQTAAPSRRAAETFRRRRLHRQQTDSTRRALIHTAAAAIPVSAVAVWAIDGGVSAEAWSGPGSALTELGIIAGLGGTALMILGLLLAARIPLVDRALGHDGALRLHRTANLGMLALLLAHAALLLLGYSLTAGTGVLAQAADFLATGDVLLGALALAGFMVVAITSILLAVRRRLPHEWWYGIHLLTYAAVIASIPHQFTQSDLFHDGPARWLWTGLYAIAAFCLLAFRVLRPALLNMEHRLRVEAVESAGTDAVAITVTGHRLRELEARGGQFFTWRFLAPGLWTHAHPFSVSASPDGCSLRLTVKTAGRGTRALQSVQPGVPVLVAGPYGRFVAETNRTDGAVLIGAGAGIAPLVGVLQDLVLPPQRMAVILRASRQEELMHLREIAAICDARGITLLPIIGRRAPGSWLSREAAHLALTDLVPWASTADVWICGPEAWARTVTAAARARGVRPAHIHQEGLSL